MVRSDCFAYQERDKKCRALKFLDCKNCAFYKNELAYKKECERLYGNTRKY